MFTLADKRLQSSYVIHLFKWIKEIMFRKLKENITAMNHQLENISRDRKYKKEQNWNSELNVQ